MTFLERIFTTSAPASVILIRLVVGAVFLSEGVQKFLFPGENGVGRFAKIGIPAPEVMAPFVGVVEIVCGALVLLGHGFWGFSLRNLPFYGFWGMAYEARTDFAMLLGSIFLLIVGAGAWSLDARLRRQAGS